jgi:hypothetical protein
MDIKKLFSVIRFLISCIFLLCFSCDFTDGQKNLHIKYENLLDRAVELVEKETFDKIRWRCDHQVMPWVKNALDAIENNAAYTAKGAEGGMSSITSVPKTPEGLIKMAIDEKQVCGIPDYIRRAESTLKPESKNFISYSKEKEESLREFLKKMKAMLIELRTRFR